MTNNMKHKLRMLSLCSGVGMLDYAAHQTGAIETVAFTEINPFCCTILNERFPDVPNMGDLHELANAPDVLLRLGHIDILAGGIPCQPWSGAGKRRGEDDDRDLWPETLAIIRCVHPTWICIENVARFARVALDRVQADLEAAEYEVRAVVLPACAVGAPHIRERVFVLAHTQRGTSVKGYIPTVFRRRTQDTEQIRMGSDGDPVGVALGDANCSRLAQRQSLGSNPRPQRATTQRTGRAERRTRLLESRFRRSLDGHAVRMDRAQWPAWRNEAQKDWEPPRTVEAKGDWHDERLTVIGNGVVWQQIYPVFAAIVAYESPEGRAS